MLFFNDRRAYVILDHHQYDRNKELLTNEGAVRILCSIFCKCKNAIYQKRYLFSPFSTIFDRISRTPTSYSRKSSMLVSLIHN